MSESESLLIVSNMKKSDIDTKPDWGRFGLSNDQQKKDDYTKLDEGNYYHTPGAKNELYTEDQNGVYKPWYRTNFFISEPVLFGTWDGVFTSCMINIFGVVIFLRTGWMVGNAGIGLSYLIILFTIVVASIAALSAIGVCERCQMERGGVYFLLSHVLGAQAGAAVGIIYCFGQAVGCSLYVVGFGESVCSLFNISDPWVPRGIAIGVVLLLLVINVAGVKWVIRLQLVLLMILLVAVMDFLVGSFVHTNIKSGVTGYKMTNIQNNTKSDYLEGESFFTVFGIFFPTATGVFAGINMSGDLANPGKNIPVGTLSAVGMSTFLYLAFTTVLGATCIRPVLQADYMIAEKVSITGGLFLAGLYISSISSCMGGLYGAPRILQTISMDLNIPFIRFLTQGRGPNKVPVYALFAITLITLIFILFGKVNTLGPIVTMPFMLTYAVVDYSYFALAMSFDKRKAREDRFKALSSDGTPNSSYQCISSIQMDAQEDSELPATFDTTHKLSGDLGPPAGAGYGTIVRKQIDSTDDLDSLFPERTHHERNANQRKPSLGNSPGSPKYTVPVSPKGDVPLLDPVNPDLMSLNSETDLTASLIQGKKVHKVNPTITQQPSSFYSIFCNRWLSLLGSFASILLMFCINWLYALAVLTFVILLYTYIGYANPGVFPGITEFSLHEWVWDTLKYACRGGPPPAEQIVITPTMPAMKTRAAQLTEDNEDFASRGRYHHSEVVEGNDFASMNSE